MKKISVTVRDTPSHLTMKKISVSVRDNPYLLTMKKISVSRHSTQSTASICCTPIRSPAIVIQTSGASRDVVYVVFLDSVHTHFSLHDPDYSGLYVQSNIVLRLFHRIAFLQHHMFLLDSSSLMSVVAASSVVLSEAYFADDIWLLLKTALMFCYGSSPRPPEICSASCLWRRFSTLVCLWSQSSLSPSTVHSHLSINVGVAVLRSLESRYSPSQGELWLNRTTFLVPLICSSDSFQGFYVSDAAAMVLHFRNSFCLISLDKKHDATIALWLLFSMMIARFQDSAGSATLLFPTIEFLILLRDSHIKHGCQEVPGSFLHFPRDFRDFRELGAVGLHCSSRRFLYGSLPRPPDVTHSAFRRFEFHSVYCSRLLQFQQVLTFVWQRHVDILTGFLFQLSTSQAQLFCFSSCDVCGMFALTASPQPLMKHRLFPVFLRRLSRDSCYFGHIFVAICRRFSTVLEILFGSLPRPPDQHCDFHLHPFWLFKYIWFSCPR